MADKTFKNVIPPLKAIDYGDGSYLMGIGASVVLPGGSDKVFAETDPPVKAIDNGDGTYSMAMVLLLE